MKFHTTDTALKSSTMKTMVTTYMKEKMLPETRIHYSNQIDGAFVVPQVVLETNISAFSSSQKCKISLLKLKQLDDNSVC